MVSTIELTNAMVGVLQQIPELVGLLDGGAEAISAYIDANPTRNSFSKAVYKMPPGSLLVIWQQSTMEEFDGQMQAWVHRHQLFIRAQGKGGSGMAVVDALIEGVPFPGDGLRWRYCPVMDGVLPTDVTEAARLTDEEGIDLFVVATATQETGDI